MATQNGIGYITGLDYILHRKTEATFKQNMGGNPFAVTVDTYTDSSMTRKDMEMVLKAVTQYKLAFYPINTAMGFAVGFEVADPTTRKAILTFKESQLPKGYDFGKLSEYFLHKDNIERAR